MEKAKWFHTSAEETLKQLGTTQEGLSAEEIEKRIASYGPNKMPQSKGKSLLSIFISQFKNPLIYILIVAGIISAVAEEMQDAIFIFVIIVINAILGTWQENKAESSANALKNLVKIKARVKRGGKILLIDSEGLVPGDVVMLESGMKVPADLRLVEVNELSIEEALLTGESLPVSKTTQVIATESPSIGDQTNMAFAATTVLKGRGLGIVVNTALQTEIGKIAESLVSSEAEKPPLIQRMESFSSKIGIVVVVICVLLGIIGWMRGMAIFDIFFFMVAVGVSAIPEGLPIALTVALSIGTNRMGKRHVIVRKLPAVEGLGSCTLIATDKTGTLTMDQQSVQKILLHDGHRINVTGQGYNGEGEIQDREGKSMNHNHTLLNQFIKTAVLANEGILRRKDSGWEHSGDAVDVSLRALAYKAGKDPGYFKDTIEIVQQVPYESERKFSGVFYKQNGQMHFAMKGAVEVINERLNKDTRQLSFDESEKLASEGYRVLALADAVVNTTDLEHLPELNLIGLAGLIDPLRPEAKVAIKECQDAGVEVIMVTGDHPATALAISKQLGIADNEHQIITGKELALIETKPIEEIAKHIHDKNVFARVTPLQKKLIVESKKKDGHFVAVTGDGANDAPALKIAHIGIAMGSGTDLAKDVASIIVTDNNFASIAAGVEEGRFTYDNLRKIIYMLLSTGAAEILLVAIPLLIGMPLPFFAVQLLWLNLVTNGFQDVALAFEKGDLNSMKKPPRKPDESIFDPLMLKELILSAIVMTVLTFGLWYYLIDQNAMTEKHARSMVMMLMVLLQNFHVLNCRSETKSLFNLPVSNNWFVFLAVFMAAGVHIAASYTPGVSDTLRLEPIHFNEWMLVLPLAFSIFVVMEIFKVFVRRVSGAR